MKVTRNMRSPDEDAKSQLVLLAKDMYDLSWDDAVKYVSRAYKQLDTNDDVMVNFKMRMATCNSDLHP